MEQTLSLNGLDLTVRYDIDSLKQSVEYVSKEYYETGYTKMYTTEEVVSKEEFEEGIKKAKHFISQLDSGTYDLTEDIDKIRKKKNQRFWKKSGHDVLILEDLNQYFTDFTNAWSVNVFRLNVISDTECELTFTARTYTH